MIDKAVLARELYGIGAVKFGEFKLKSGMLSPVYLDLRVLVTYPRTLRMVAQSMAQVLSGISFDRLAAIPYAALPIGTAIALEMDRPLVYPRNARKEYGTGHSVEGEFRAGERAVVIDDVITTGASKIEAIAPLVAAGLTVQDIVVLVDREQRGAAELGTRGYRVHSVMSIIDIVGFLRQERLIDENRYRQVIAFIRGTR